MPKINLKENLHWIIPSFITAWSFVIWQFSIWIIFLLVSVIYIIYHFSDKIWNFYNLKLKEKINKFWKLKFFWIVWFIIFTLFWTWVYSYYFSELKIFTLIEWFDLKFEDNFEWWNISNNDDFKWIISDNQFANWDNNSKTLKTSSLKERGYPIYQDLKDLSWEKILLTKFYLPEAARIWIQFVNTNWFESNEKQKNNFQECRIQTFEWVRNWMNYSRWYWDIIYRKEWPFQKEEDITEWNYYLLAKISWNKLSCYFQKEWEKDYKEIILNKDISFENWWWPIITRFIDDKRNYPEILEFKLYSN